MSTGLKILGVSGCLAFGLGGGYGVRSLSYAAPAEERAEARPVSAPPLKISALVGGARVLGRGGEWRPARKDDALFRPTGFEVGRGVSSLTLGAGPLSVIASHGARALLNAKGQPLRVYLEDGHVVVTDKEPVTVVISRDGTEVSGRSFGVKLEDSRILVSGITGDVELKRRGQSSRIPAGSEAVLSSVGYRQAELPAQLGIQVESIQKQGAKWQIKGRTNPAAWALLRNEKGAYASLPLDGEGRFTVLLDAAQPAPGELIAFDSAGRSAEVGLPSGAPGSEQPLRHRIDPSRLEAAAPPPGKPAAASKKKKEPTAEATAAPPAAPKPAEEDEVKLNW